MILKSASERKGKICLKVWDFVQNSTEEENFFFISNSLAICTKNNRIVIKSASLDWFLVKTAEIISFLTKSNNGKLVMLYFESFLKLVNATDINLSGIAY